MHRIRKAQFDLCALRLSDTTAPAAWNAVLFNRSGIQIYKDYFDHATYLHRSHKTNLTLNICKSPAPQHRIWL
ncbi:hypothetical protein OKW33_006133 [Paraburkholderia atlantica]